MKTKTGKYGKWIQEEGLIQVKNWAAKGCTSKEIANNMGISMSTLYEWMKKYPQIGKAVRDGKAMTIQAVENMLFQQAMGETYEEQVITEKRIGPDGKEHVNVRNVKTRKAPSTAAAIFLLKNRAGYSDNPSAKPNEVVPQFTFDPSAWAKKTGKDDQHR